MPPCHIHPPKQLMHKDVCWNEKLSSMPCVDVEDSLGKKSVLVDLQFEKHRKQIQVYMEQTFIVYFDLLLKDLN